MQLLIRRLFLFLVIRLFASPLPLPVRSLPCCFSSYYLHMFLVPCFSGFVMLSNFSRSPSFLRFKFCLSPSLPFFMSFHFFSTLLIPLLVPFPGGSFGSPFFQDLIGVVPALKPLCFSNSCFVLLITTSRRFCLAPPLFRNTFSFCCFTTFSLSNVPFLFLALSLLSCSFFPLPPEKEMQQYAKAEPQRQGIVGQKKKPDQ